MNYRCITYIGVALLSGVSLGNAQIRPPGSIPQPTIQDAAPGVDNTARTLHGALLDCELLAAVYLEMTRGQETLAIGLDTARAETRPSGHVRPRPVLFAAPAEDLAAHAVLLDAIDRESRGACLWRPAGEAG